MGEVHVRDVDIDDLGEIARLHREAFPESILSELGEEAVRRNYRWQIEGPHDLVAIVADDDSGTLGFLFGGVFLGSTIGFVKSQRWFLARKVLLHPRILMRGVGWNRVALGVRLLARRSAPGQSEAPEAVPRDSLGVLAIAVDPRSQGRGVGRVLIEEATRRARELGFSYMHLTVNPANDSAVGFYRTLGWEPMTPDGTSWAGSMKFDLSGD